MDTIFHEDYKGPRWTYGLRNRPLMIGAQPKGFIIGSEGPDTEQFRWGTIQYPRQLTDAEVASFELVPVSDLATVSPKKTITLTLAGLDGNAFVLMGAFQQQAEREGWKKEEIREVLKECMSGDYDHLLQTLAERCVESPVDSEDDEDENHT